MKRITCTIIILMTVISLSMLSFSTSVKAITETTAIQLEQSLPSYCDDALLSLIYPYISNAVDEYYGKPKQFDIYNNKILSIKKNTEAFEFEVVVQITTFTGPHNPPRGIDTITIKTSPTGTKVVNFIHKAE